MNINNRQYKFAWELSIAGFWIPYSRLLRLLGNFTVNGVFPYECLKKGEGFAKLNLKQGVFFVLQREKSDVLVKPKYDTFKFNFTLSNIFRRKIYTENV